MSLGPFDLNGSQFLQLYLMLSVACILFSLIIPALMRPPGHERRVEDADQLALLSGGPTRLAETAIVRMMRTGAVRVNHLPIIAPLVQASATRPIDAAIYKALPAEWSVVEQHVKDHSGPILARLAANGLMIDDETKKRVRWLQTIPYITLFLFGTTKLMIGIERGKPVLFLTGLLFLTLIFGIIRWAGIDMRTTGGKRSVADMRRAEDRLRRAPTEPETERAVALFGTVVLATSVFAAFYRLRQASAGDGVGVSSGCGSGGSSSSGGGGCGGCGGD